MRRRISANRLFRWAAALVGAGLAATSPVAAQTVSPSAAPAEWVRYAEGATSTITSWLEADGEPASRFRAYLDRTRASDADASQAIELRVWIAPDGEVSRIAFTPFAHQDADTDLRAAIVGRRLPAPPPDMLLPLRIAVQLEPAAADASPAGPSDGA